MTALNAYAHGMNEKMWGVTVRFSDDKNKWSERLDEIERHARECPIEHTYRTVLGTLQLGPVAYDAILRFEYTHLSQEDAERVVRHWDKRFEETTVQIGDHEELWPTPDEDLEKSYMAE